MTEYLDPFDYIQEQNISEELELTLKDPFAVNFRSNDKDKISVEPEDELIRSARVDRANKNVEVQFNPQSVEEKYIVVLKDIGLGLVESRANTPTSKYTSATTMSYHVVTPDVGLFYDGQGYRETSNTLPRQATIKAPELLERAENLGEADFKNASKLEPPSGEVEETPAVPPPRKDRLFDD